MSEPEGPGVETRPVTEIAVDPDNLYREEVITDLKAATLRRLVPIQADGSPDASRPALFLAETQLLTQGGLLPVQARLEAETLEQAIEIFPQAINEAVERHGGEVVKREAHLALSFAQEALTQGGQSFFFFFGAEPAAVDDGFEFSGGSQSGARYPTSYSGSIQALDAA